jgi:hypothetical protein
MELTLAQLKALANENYPEEWFLDSVKTKLSSPITNFSQIETLTKSQLDDLYDAVFDTLVNETELRSSYRAEQDKGEYFIQVRGFNTAWFIQAPEYDDVGFFDTPAKADEYISFNFGEFLLDKTDKEALDEVKQTLDALDKETLEFLSEHIKSNIPENVSQELWDTLQRTTKDLPIREKIMNYEFVAYKIDERIEQKRGDIN